MLQSVIISLLVILFGGKKEGGECEIPADYYS
jgi:hypothetical protein